MEDRETEQTNPLEQRGLLRFVLFRGVLAFGGCMALFLGAMTAWKYRVLARNGVISPEEASALSWELIPSALVYGLLAGLVWGIGTWLLMKRRSRLRALRRSS